MIMAKSHLEKLECYACHSTWAPQCYGCHVKVDYSKGKKSVDWIASGNIQLADSGQVVVTGNADMLVLPQKLNTRARVGAIADDISQAPHLLHPSPTLNIFKHRGKGSQIGVNISQQSVTHPATYYHNGG